MEKQRARSPPAYTQYEQYDSATLELELPAVPTHSLPSLRSLHLPDAQPPKNTNSNSNSNSNSAQWAALPRMAVSVSDVGSPMDVDRASVASNDERRRGTSVVSIDDPDVRLAAEALSGLGNPDFVRSPATTEPTPPEPLLNLLTSAHPWLGGSINGSISAYNTTKTYSPRLFKYGAELLERNIASPVVNTVSSVGRRTGVEQNLRRYLGDHRRPSDLEHGAADRAGKRLRVASPRDMDVEGPVEAAGEAEDDHLEHNHAAVRTRGASQSSCAESLPAYDDHRSPQYEETAVVAVEKEQPPQSAQDRRVAWSTQLIMTTSGLGIALSDASLRSLKICLRLLRGATRHIDSVMRALKLVVDEYEAALRNARGHASNPYYASSDDVTMTDDASSSAHAHDDAQVRAIADRMKRLSTDIWTTLQSVVTSVSRYTGGALPQNASQVVRTQLLSVPQRWHLASRNTAAATSASTNPSDGGEAGGGAGAEEVRGANRMLAFASEGLDMMGQITTVVDGTVQSAEGWLSRIGRQAAQLPEDQDQDQDEKAPLSGVYVDVNAGSGFGFDDEKK